MIVDMDSSKDLLEKLKIANDLEGDAIEAILSAKNSGITDSQVLIELVKRMEESRNNIMAIYEQLAKISL